MILLKSYFTDRQIYVSVDKFDSQIRTTNVGLPQGSVSAPLLFSLYINDMNRKDFKQA